MPCVTTLKPWQRRATARHFPIPWLPGINRPHAVAARRDPPERCRREDLTTGVGARRLRRVGSVWCTAKPIFPTRGSDARRARHATAHIPMKRSPRRERGSNIEPIELLLDRPRPAPVERRCCCTPRLEPLLPLFGASGCFHTRSARRGRAGSSPVPACTRRPPRHRRDACSMAPMRMKRRHRREMT